MNADNGWIKLHRKVLDWEWYDTPGMFHLFFHLLVSANVEDKRWRGKVIRRGEFVTSYESLALKMKCSVRNIRTRLSRLKSTNEITIKSTNQYSIITICNYDKYQITESQSDTQNDKQSDKRPTNDRQTTDKQLTTTKEYKNIRINKEENIIINNNIKEESQNSVNFDEIREFFNRTMTGRMIPKIKTIDDRRKSWIMARLKTFSLDDLYEAFTKASESTFLNGDNQRGFIATFDWIVRPTNFPKILEGNYDDRRPATTIGPKAGRNPLEGCVPLNGTGGTKN